MFDNTVWLLPPHPPFNVVFSSLARRCRISVIQLLCFCDNFFLPMLNGEHEGQDSKCVWWCRIFSINRLQKSCLLVFWLSCSVAWNACRICMFACKSVCMYVCMYVCTYLLKHRFALESIYIEIFLDSSQTVCFQLQLGTRVCFYSARTVHVQCTHSARPQCTGSKRCKYHRKWPLGFKT